jgi:hypothetical protein
MGTVGLRRQHRGNLRSINPLSDIIELESISLPQPGILTSLGKLFRSKAFYFGAAVLIGGAILNQVGSVYVYNNFHDTPALRDTILMWIPHYRLSYAFDAAAIMTIFIFCAYAIKGNTDKIPYFLLVFGILQVIRALFIVLTPLRNPDLGVYNGFLQAEEAFRRGLFPSGHTGSSFLAFLLARGVWKVALLTSSMCVIVFLFLAHGHYSIDIFAALIFAYAVYRFGERRFKRKFTLK